MLGYGPASQAQTWLGARQCKFLKMPLRALVVMTVMPMFVYASAPSGRNVITAINVMPMPASVNLSAGKLRIYLPFTVGTSGYSDRRLEKAVVRMQHRLRRRTGLTLSLGLAAFGTPPTLTVAVKEKGPAYPKFGEDESYSLEINSEHAALTADTVVGALRGMETFSQLEIGRAHV